MFRLLKELIAREQFNPNILGLFINPFYFARKGLYQSVSVLIVRLNVIFLIVVAVLSRMKECVMWITLC